MANPITECDRVRSYAAPDPPFWTAAASWLSGAASAQIGTLCITRRRAAELSRGFTRIRALGRGRQLSWRCAD